ncbi:MAG: TIGR03960 family B12-binding radical SAM protein [Thermoguttaceae bacterium]
MPDASLRDILINRVLPRVQFPGQYIGGEWNSICKDRAAVRGRLCLAFPEPYTIGMSCYGLQVLYTIMNGRSDWACERAFTPLTDLESLLRERGLPLVSLESFTPLVEFDVVGFSLQHELSATNVLTMLDLGGIPLKAESRTMAVPLILAGGPGSANPEPMARFVDAFVLGDGEEALPAVCDLWLEMRRAGLDRMAALARLAAALPYVYVPRFYQPQFDAHGRPAGLRPIRDDLPPSIEPAVVQDLDTAVTPLAPIVPFIECVHERIAIEIMRGCPWRCRFCQSRLLKHPVRFRRVATIVAAALQAYRATGHREVALLGLSSSDYPQIEELLTQLHAVFRPLGVSISMPSLRVNARWRSISDLLDTDRGDGLTLAPEAASDEMRQQIGKPISNDDLFAGCCRAMQNKFSRVKLYFMCGLPGEGPADLDGIIDMAEEISRMGKSVLGRYATVVVNISNFIPKPQTPYQRAAMQSGAYFEEAHEHLRQRKRMRSVALRFTDVDSTLIEATLCRGDRRLGPVIESVWRRGARMDAWAERMRPWLWRDAIADAGVDLEAILHQPYAEDATLPWEHMKVLSLL